MRTKNEDDRQDFQDIIKIILVGDAGTGKTNIAYCFTRQKIPNNIMPTIAVEFASKLVSLDNGQMTKVQIWDTAGQQAYRSLTMSYYRKMNGAVLVFDVTKRSSFDHVRYWLQNIRQKGDPNVQILLLGHKSDVTRREVRYEQGKQLALQQHVFYAETTIKDPQSINTSMKKLIGQISDVMRNGVDNSNNDFKLARGQRTQRCAC